MNWVSIGTVVGNASTYQFTFVLKSFGSRVGDLVAVKMKVPSDDYGTQIDVVTWGRITAIERFNPFFPLEAANELAEEGVSFRDTILSSSRDQLQADVLILGWSPAGEEALGKLYPLTYPVQPAADVLHPPAEAIRALLVGGMEDRPQLEIGSLLARNDVPVTISADHVVARHMAILAMTGGGKSVAARRVLAELVKHRYPVVIFDPHGDYIGLWEARKRNVDLLKDCTVKLFYPHLSISSQNQGIIEVLIAKMTVGLSEPQKEYTADLLQSCPFNDGETVLSYVQRLIAAINRDFSTGDGRKKPTMGAVRRSLRLVAQQLEQMQATNEKMRKTLRHLDFEELPDPEGQPEAIVRPNQVSILYLSAG